MVLGGVRIDGSPGLAGHSDADVVSHAIADALLGAAGLGDLGDRFPADDRWRDASSLDILSETARLVRDAGWEVGNVDATVVAQTPRLAPHRAAMAAAVAGALGVASTLVSVKATTTDGLGFAGRAEGICALAAVLLRRTVARDGR
ncbi:MAG TPA: 2-C-methyl-D-erythritol 2,4-cyclodiphosphate synthase [Actinomycetota bacterium]|nr:2-C-methyl-D-erythritol 2,4-cyclodiphosphate synthase [Actinomycetota bacterium]